MLIKNIPKEERRKYKRLDTIFPVEFQILDQGLNLVSGWHHGFSQDISKGGICLIIHNFSKEEFSNIVPQKTNLLLQIHSPIFDRCFLAYAKVVWIRKIKDVPFTQYAVGINFTRIDTKEIERLINHTRIRKVIWRTLQIIILGILLLLSFFVVSNFRLNVHNQLILTKYSELLYKDLELKQSYEALLEEREGLNRSLGKGKIEMEILKETIKKAEYSKAKEMEMLEKELSEAKKLMVGSEEEAVYVRGLKEKLEAIKNAKDTEISRLQKELLSLVEKENILQAKFSEVVAKESEVKGAFSIVEGEEMVLAEEFKQQLYNWLKTHQNERTGLIVSFEGDYNLRDISYVYDQALAITTYTLFEDYHKAKKGLDFFINKAKRVDGGGFYNAYYANSGEVCEFMAHAGPNLWLGIAIAQYSKNSKDYTYINTAKQIANWIQALQDAEGGIVGGKGIGWYSTEHNLDGYAFFNMLYELTNEKEYRDAANKIFNWLKKYAYSNSSIPVNRGKGDSTIATDTYAWSIAALGPARLKEINMDPDGILEFTMENCAVTTDFTDRFGKNIIVSGFDFAKPQHIARGGVISCEWTAQMILSFNIMSDYYRTNGDLKKSTYYQNEALKYLNELNKMTISSLSAFGQGNWCLPYASQEDVDTGHGWRTPRGSRTGSVAATAYTIFAISKFNPLKFQE